MPVTPRFTTIPAGATYAGVSSDTIRRRIADGSLKAYRFGPRQIRIDLADLEAMFRPIPSARCAG